MCSCAYVNGSNKPGDINIYIYIYMHIPVLAYEHVDTSDRLFFASSSWPKGAGQLMPGYNRCSLIAEAEKFL
jgi:hypothetical protein